MGRSALREPWNMGVRLKHSPEIQRPRQTALKDKRNSHMLTTLPLSLCRGSTTLRGLPRGCGFTGEKRAQDGHPVTLALGITSWESPRQFYSTGMAGKSLGLTLWQRRGKGIAKSGTWILSYLKHWRSSPNQSFAHLQRKGSGTVQPENSAG